MKKKIFSLVMCGVLLFCITGCNNSSKFNEEDKNNQNINNTNQDNDTEPKSEFEKAIENYKNAKSISIEMKQESAELNSDYVTKKKAEILLDYKNNLIDFHTTYSYVSLMPSTDKTVDYHTYYDIKTNRVYTYDHHCETWYYYNSSYKEDSRYLEYLDKILYLNEDDAKKVGNNYHFSSKDIMIDQDNITWFRLEGTGGTKVSESIEYTFKSFNDTVVSLPDGIKNAIKEKDLCD